MLNINRFTPRYDEAYIKPMRDELSAVGFAELRTSAEVEKAIFRSNNETVMVVINSVCACAAGSARPGVSLALQHTKIPNHLTTVFAGQDLDAVDKVRELINLPPSSPFIAIFRNGKPIYLLPRHKIGGRSASEIAMRLTKVFEVECFASGPSISPEEFDKIGNGKFSDSKIPAFHWNKRY